VKPDVPHILLVNPWIHDFAAYDFWAKPLGLLTLAALLKGHGFNVSYIDCLDRFHPCGARSDPHARWGRGPYLKTRIAKPAVLADVPRHFSRYGILPEWLQADLARVPKPDLILVTSLMTYWYTGLGETISHLKAVYPDTPVVVGGIYATLCQEHAVRFSGADRVVSGPGEAQLFQTVGELTGFDVRPHVDPEDLNAYPYPSLELQHRIAYVPLMTSRGCPFRCAYCASHIVSPKFLRRDAAQVFEEIRYWHAAYGARDFVFYDDALLVDAEAYAQPLLEAIIGAGLDLRFHTPNAVHIREISRRIAGLMAKAGFKTLRLGLETTLFEKRRDLDRKVTAAEFTRAAGFLRAAGFGQENVGAYLLAGLPGQSLAPLEASIATVKACGITPVLAYYSPIPHTALWPAAVASSRYDLASDPLLTNNSILPCRKEAFDWATLSHLKNLAAP